jgi:hypothetical protein
VLSIRPTKSGVALTAGTHYTDAARAPQSVELLTGDELAAAVIKAIKDAVGAANRRTARRRGVDRAAG